MILASLLPSYFANVVVWSGARVGILLLSSRCTRLAKGANLVYLKFVVPALGPGEGGRGSVREAEGWRGWVRVRRRREGGGEAQRRARGPGQDSERQGFACAACEWYELENSSANMTS